MTFSESAADGPRVEGTAVFASSRRVDGTLVLSIGGEIDLAGAPRLRPAMDAALAQKAAVLIVDLTEVTFLSSSGIGALVDIRRRAGQGTAVRVVATTVAARPISLTAVNQLMPVFGTLAEAIRG
ncbi:STAS domain-containing protein [Amycolatopsis sp. NPDC098790]|uniref:STAS domain-containing protein n=1 Tax=Amycolatopsis sp. NPDC098790 TaxID=3363939 RepID=UPI0037F78548